MNDLLQLKGTFNQKKNTSRPGSPTLPKNASVKIEKLRKLRDDLNEMVKFWTSESLIKGALVSVYYSKIIAKSRRIEGYLSKGSSKANDSIRGARFTDNTNLRKHIITHYVPMEILVESIKRLDASIKIVGEHFGGVVKAEAILPENLISKNIDYKGQYGIAKTNFLNIVVDSHYVEKFAVLEEFNEFDKNTIVTLFDTDSKPKELLEKIGIELSVYNIIDRTTVFLTKDQLYTLQEKASYLISMATEDLSMMVKSDILDVDENVKYSIDSPSIEPTIGVIDTMFDESVYCSEWVESKRMIDENIGLDSKDYFHGTAVTSIIVDGPRLNPELDDNCGNFKVKHFGVATHDKFSSFSIIKAIKQIVIENRDIKVWNISLGSIEEVNPNFISPEASILDEIQYENDVIFVISGTNKTQGDETTKRIGAPADSINSLIVNSVDENNQPPSYAREGIVLSFYNKPDVSCFGGSRIKPIKVITDKGECNVMGTSFAAPWITRKMAYLIHVMGFTREVAKALIIDSALEWESEYSIDESSLLGHGIVPVLIDDVVKSKSDEIKFVLTGRSEAYDTYNYNIPVPVFKNEHPFIAKATLCYFPKCSRNQGVDYTNTELDIYFGRIDDKSKIKTINNNTQSESVGRSYLNEDVARKYYRKWDNSKHIKEIIKPNTRGRKVYSNKMWGLSIKTKERLNIKYGVGMSFGVVITLKEINGVNRIEEFIQQCFLRGWLVNRVTVENRMKVYLKSDEIIELE